MPEIPGLLRASRGKIRRTLSSDYKPPVKSIFKAARGREDGWGLLFFRRHRTPTARLHRDGFRRTDTTHPLVSMRSGARCTTASARPPSATSPDSPGTWKRSAFAYGEETKLASSWDRSEKPPPPCWLPHPHLDRVLTLSSEHRLTMNISAQTQGAQGIENANKDRARDAEGIVPSFRADCVPSSRRS
jgi:hypothetical protein